MRSASVIASSWSCVTITVVIPRRRCSSRSSTCMLSRRLLSSAPNGSSSSRHGGLDDQRSGEGHALLLATGQLRRQFVLVAAELHQVQRFLHALACGPTLDAAHFETEHDVLGHRQMREKRVALEQHADVAAMHRGSGDRRPVDEYLAAAGLHQTSDHSQAGGFAAATGAEQGDEFAGFDG